VERKGIAGLVLEQVVCKTDLQRHLTHWQTTGAALPQLPTTPLDTLTNRRNCATSPVCHHCSWFNGNGPRLQGITQHEAGAWPKDNIVPNLQGGESRNAPEADMPVYLTGIRGAGLGQPSLLEQYSLGQPSLSEQYSLGQAPLHSQNNKAREWGKCQVWLCMRLLHSSMSSIAPTSAWSGQGRWSVLRGWRRSSLCAANTRVWVSMGARPEQKGTCKKIRVSADSHAEVALYQEGWARGKPDLLQANQTPPALGGSSQASTRSAPLWSPKLGMPCSQARNVAQAAAAKFMGKQGAWIKMPLTA